MSKTPLVLALLALLISFILIIAGGCGSPSNLEWVKARASDTWEKQGFEVVGYAGYQWGHGGFGTSYGGAKVWYRLRKIPDNGISYSGYLQRWGDEVHAYGPEATDAIRP